MSCIARGVPFGFFEVLKLDLGLRCAASMLRLKALILRQLYVFYRGVIRGYLERDRRFA